MPGFDDPAGNGEGAVGKDELVVDFNDAAKATTKGAGPEGVVEGKQRGAGFVKIPAITGAVIATGVEMVLFRLVSSCDGGGALAKTETGGECLGEAGAVFWGEGDLILDHRQEKFFLAGLAEGAVQDFQAFFLVQTNRRPFPKDAAKTLSCDKGSRLVRRGFFREGDPEEEPGLLVGEFFQEVLENGMGSPWADGFPAIRAGKFGETGEEEFKVVGDFGDCADGAAGGANGVGLAQRDGRLKVSAYRRWPSA
ncbi:MAG: hypothetical protein EBT50_07205 [Verrucomicrobia bacterium]|nr:hypothetical protein [Verrucomicrobiota bacterium]